MNAHELQQTSNGFTNTRTFKNYLSILNKVNDHYGWKPDVIYFDRMNNNPKDIADFIYETYEIVNTAQYKQKMSALSSFMTRTNFDKEHNIRYMVTQADKYLSVADKSKLSQIPDWVEVLQPQLEELGKENSIRGIIARIFSYGYVLRVGEFFQTRIANDDGVKNYLDLDNCNWIIRNQKNGCEKVFDVDPELCLSLKKSKSKSIRNEWLISKQNGDGYKHGSYKLKPHGWPLPDNVTIRKSFETFNSNDPNRTQEERDRWHYILGHSRQTVNNYYDQIRLANFIGEEIVEIDPSEIKNEKSKSTKPRIPKPKKKIKVKVTLKTLKKPRY